MTYKKRKRGGGERECDLHLGFFAEERSDCFDKCTGTNLLQSKEKENTVEEKVLSSAGEKELAVGRKKTKEEDLGGLHRKEGGVFRSSWGA